MRGASGRPTKNSSLAFTLTGKRQRQRNLLYRRRCSVGVAPESSCAGHKMSRLLSFGTRGTRKKQDGLEVIKSTGQSSRRGITAVIPARGGSKGLPGKNMATVGGISLIARAVMVAQKLESIDNVLVSTDDDNIASEALRHGAVVHRRSEQLSADDAVVVDLIREIFGIGQESSAPSSRIGNSRHCVLLEPTAPFRSVPSVAKCLENVLSGADSSATLAPASVHPERVFRIEGEGVKPFIPGAVAWKPRQSFEPAFQLTGGAYVFDLQSLPNHGLSLAYGIFRSVLVDERETMDIDGPLDLSIAQYLSSTIENATTEKRT